MPNAPTPSTVPAQGAGQDRQSHDFSLLGCFLHDLTKGLGLSQKPQTGEGTAMQQLVAIPADGDAACAPCRCEHTNLQPLSVWSCGTSKWLIVSGGQAEAGAGFP